MVIKVALVKLDKPDGVFYFAYDRNGTLRFKSQSLSSLREDVTNNKNAVEWADEQRAREIITQSQQTAYRADYKYSIPEVLSLSQFATEDQFNHVKSLVIWSATNQTQDKTDKYISELTSFYNLSPDQVNQLQSYHSSVRAGTYTTSPASNATAPTTTTSFPALDPATTALLLVGVLVAGYFLLGRSK